MTDGSDELPDEESPSGATRLDPLRQRRRSNADPSGPSPLSWPLVERRRSTRTPPDGIDRRKPRFGTVTPTLSAAPLWPFRLAALAGALIRITGGVEAGDLPTLFTTVSIVAYTTYVCRNPLPYRNDQRVRLRILLEQLLNTLAVLFTGAWGSPFVLLFVPTGMLAGFAAGGIYSLAVSMAAVVVVSVQHLIHDGTSGVTEAVLWAGLLGLVAFTSGLAHRAAYDAARQQQVALDRVSRLAEANSLLFALQRVAQTLPASLDLEEVLDSTMSRLRTMVRHDALAVFLVEPTTRRAVPARTNGISEPRQFSIDRLPAGLRTAVESPKTVRLDDMRPGSGITAEARSGLYAALRARGALVGMVAVESSEPNAFGQQQSEVVHGLSEPFGIAIDNARMFTRIRTLAADEERTRIARDLHDHVGSSLALIGFEVDRAMAVAGDDEEISPVLRELRQQVSAVVSEVRDMLYDLRTEVTDERDLGATTAEFLHRVQQRSGIMTHGDVRIPMRPPRLIERELWQIVREAILNAERHSQAEHIMVSARQLGERLTITVRDDGIGLDATIPRPDSYGLVGMRERAHRLDAALSVRGLDGGGTEMRLELFTGGDTPL